MSFFSFNFNYSRMYPNYYSTQDSSDQSRYSGYYNQHSNYGGYQHHGYYNNNQYGSYYNNNSHASTYRSNNPYRSYSYSSDNLNRSDYYDNNNRRSTCDNGYVCEESKAKPLTSSCVNLSQYNNSANSNSNYYNSYGYGSTDQLNKQQTSNSYSYNNLHSNSYSNLSYDNSADNSNNYHYTTTSSSSGNNYSNINNPSSSNQSSSNQVDNKNNEYQTHSNYETTLNDYYKSYNNNSSNNMNTKACPCSHHGSTTSLASNNYPTNTSNDNYYSSHQTISTNANYSQNSNYDKSYENSNYQVQKPVINSTSTSNLKSYGSVDQLNTSTAGIIKNNDECEDGYTCSDFVPLSQANLLDNMFSSSKTNLSNQNYTKTHAQEQPETFTSTYAKAIPLPAPTTQQTSTLPSSVSVPKPIEVLNPAITPASVKKPVTIKESTTKDADKPVKITEYIKPKITHHEVKKNHKEKPNKSTTTTTTQQTKSDKTKSRLSFKESVHSVQSPFKVISEKSTLSSMDSIPSFTTLDHDESFYGLSNQRDFTFGDFVGLNKGRKYGHALDSNSHLNSDTKTEYLSQSYQSSANLPNSYKSEFKGNKHDLVLDKMVNEISNDLYSSYKANDSNQTLYQPTSKNNNYLNQSSQLITDQSRNTIIPKDQIKNDRLDLLLDQLVSSLTNDREQKQASVNYKNNNKNTSQYNTNYGFLNSLPARSKENYSREFKAVSNYDPELENFYAKRNYSIYDTLTSKQSSDYLSKTYDNKINSEESTRLNLSNKSTTYQDWKSLGLLSTFDSQSSSGYTNELFGSNKTPDGVPLRDLLESASSYSFKDKKTDANEKQIFGYQKQNSNLYNYGKTYKINGSGDNLYNKQDNTLDLIAKYLKK